MFRGLLVIVLAASVIGAPVATDACQAVCASRSAESATRPATAQHHSCHAEAPPSGPSVIAVHPCGHTNELPGIARLERSPERGPERGMTTAFAIVPTAAVVGPGQVATSGVAPIQFSPPPLTARTSQLRL